MLFQRWWKACWPVTLVISGGMAASLPESTAGPRGRLWQVAPGPAEHGADEEPEDPVGLGPQERLLPDGSHTGSWVYVDAHGDLVRVKYVAGPAAGPRGFYVEERPVDDGGAGGEPLEPMASGMAPLLLPPPRAVRRDTTPRPSDVFWQPKERADLTKAGPARPARPQRMRRKSHG